MSICHFVAVTPGPPKPSRNLPSSLIGQISIVSWFNEAHSDSVEEGDDMNKTGTLDTNEGRKRSWTNNWKCCIFKTYFYYGKFHTPGA